MSSFKERVGCLKIIVFLITSAFIAPFLLMVLGIWLVLVIDMMPAFLGWEDVGIILWFKRILDEGDPAINNVQLLMAVGTLGVVIYAVFKDSIYNWAIRPKLRPVFEFSDHYVHNNQQEEGGNAIYIGLKIYNDGRSVAENVSVEVLRLSGWKNNGEKIDFAIDRPLAPGRKDDQKNPYPSIQPLNRGSWTIGMIADPKYRKNYKEYRCREEWVSKYRRDEPALVLALQYKLADGVHIVGPGKYKLDLLVSADKAVNVFATIEVDTSRINKWPEKIGIDDVEKKDYEREMVCELLDISIMRPLLFGHLMRVWERFYTMIFCRDIEMITKNRLKMF